MDRYEEVLAFWQGKRVKTDAELAEVLNGQCISYAYHSGIGKAKIRLDLLPDPRAVQLTFIDSGMPYDPLAKEDPDITLPASKRQIGGLGIFMAKKLMDDIEYEYLGGKNILRMKKYL